MNFYIGNTVSDIDLNDINVEFRDDLLEYIYNLKGRTELNVESLIKIDPYSDVIISNDEVSIIVEICDYLVKTLLFKDYDDQDEAMEAMEALMQLRELGKLAIEKEMGLISIGD